MRHYERHILPRLIDLSMRQQRLLEYRRATVSPARGTVVEIGVGSGHNLSLDGPPVDRVFALDPSPELLTMAESRLAKHAITPSVVLPPSSISSSRAVTAESPAAYSSICTAAITRIVEKATRPSVLRKSEWSR
jgi:protein-L-isoaspartate O-methyltransferase